MKTTTQQLDDAKQNIAKLIIKYVTISDKLGQRGTQGATITEAIFESFNTTNMSSTALEHLRNSLNNWHEQNEELFNAFTQKPSTT